MLEGLEISEVNYSFLNNDLRIDAEYFGKELLKDIGVLNQYGVMQISSIANVTDGIHTSIDYDDNSNVNLISATSPKDNVFDLSRRVFISEKSHKLNPRTALKVNDVVISTVGTVGNCAVVDNSILPANTDRHVGIIRIKDKYSPYALSTFMVSKYGRMQSLRESTGNVQLNLFIYKLKELLIPNFDICFQNKIEQIVKDAHATLSKSKRLYSESIKFLFDILGLQNWHPIDNQSNVKFIKESFLVSGRLDAEHYQMKYDELEDIIKSVPYKTIAELNSFNARGVQPNYIEGGDVSVVNSKHILEDGLDYDNFEHTTTDFLSLNKRAQIGYGDILIYTTGANIGRTQVYLRNDYALASNHVNILRVKGVNPLYLALVLNSKIGRLQTAKFSTGSAQAELYPYDIDRFIVPILPTSIQDHIASKIQESFTLRAESRRLLDEAKRMVEMEIEK